MSLSKVDEGRQLLPGKPTVAFADSIASWWQLTRTYNISVQELLREIVQRDLKLTKKARA